LIESARIYCNQSDEALGGFVAEPLQQTPHPNPGIIRVAARSLAALGPGLPIGPSLLIESAGTKLA